MTAAEQQAFVVYQQLYLLRFFYILRLYQINKALGLRNSLEKEAGTAAGLLGKIAPTEKDPTGHELAVQKKVDDKTGETEYNLKFTARIVDKSKQKLTPEELDFLANEATEKIMKDYTGKSKNAKWNIEVNIDTSAAPEDSTIDPKSRHTIEITDKVLQKKKASVASAVGLAPFYGGWMKISGQKARDTASDDLIYGEDSFGGVVSHEIGHSGGLDHSHVENKKGRMSVPDDNFMDAFPAYPPEKRNGATLEQIEQIYQNYDAGKLNRGLSVPKPAK